MNSPYNGKFRVSQKFKGASHDGLDLVGVDNKEIHSTVNGVVEKAGWERKSNPKFGFGLYVRVKKDDSVDKYYFGHMSEVRVKDGDRVKIGDILGIEGNTGNSTGSHCHYCVRGNGLKSQVRDVSAISGIPNQLGTYDDGYSAKQDTPKKNIETVAREVVDGKWGNGSERKQRLEKAGYSYAKVQSLVNQLLTTTKKSNEEIANEVVKGLWGNGAERRKRLVDAGYNYSIIQTLVNNILK